jgi:tetratricopeptide (TPR) repeat protein
MRAVVVMLVISIPFTAGAEQDPSKSTADRILEVVQRCQSSTDIDGCLSDWIEREPDNDALFAARALERFEARELPKALADIGRAIEIAPEDSAHYLLRSRIRRETGDESGSDADEEMARRIKKTAHPDLLRLDAAIADNPEEPRFYLERSTVLASRGDSAGAISDLERYAELMGERADPLQFLRLSSLRLSLGDDVGAVSALSAGIALSPPLSNTKALLLERRANLRRNLLGDVEGADQDLIEREKILEADNPD